MDEVKFSLAIMNLVENGIKYNGNQKDGYVQVTLDADHQFCYIRVEDNGIGIPEDRRSWSLSAFTAWTRRAPARPAARDSGSQSRRKSSFYTRA